VWDTPVLEARPADVVTLADRGRTRSQTGRCRYTRRPRGRTRHCLWRAILKLTCWACGANLSTLERKGAGWDRTPSSKLGGQMQFSI